MSRNRFALLFAAIATLVLVGASLAVANDNGGKKNIKSDRMSGYQEAPPVSTTGSGRFRAELNRSTNTITWKLEWANLSGTANAAHLHFGQRGVSAGIVVPLCAPCGAATGSTTGTITQASITPTQGLDTFAELLAAIRAGRVYVNIHTTAFMAGEIRGQLNNSNHR